MHEQSKTQWARLSIMTDADIDMSDIPELDDAFFEMAQLHVPKGADVAGTRNNEARAPDDPK